MWILGGGCGNGKNHQKANVFSGLGGEFGEPLGANIGSLGGVVGWRGGGGGGGVSGSVGWWGCGVGLWGAGWCVPQC